MCCKEIMNFRDWIKKAAGAKAPPQPFDFAHVQAGWHDAGAARGDLIGFDGTDGDGVVLLGSGDGDFRPGLFVESGQSGLIAGL